MPQSNLPRNVYVYDNNVFEGNPPILVAGFFQFGRTIAQEFYANLEICFREPYPTQFRLIDTNGMTVARDESVVAIGNYFVVSVGYHLHVSS